MIDKTNIDKSKAWPFIEAKKILRERKKNIENKGKIILQTGYGPSGLPHIGTFGEVARTSMVVNALNQLTDFPKEIITFSDWIYKYNWDRNNISEITNLTIQELDQSAEKIKVYFKDNEEYLNVSILRDNQSLSIFKQKEIDHMTDVKHLIKLVMGFQRISALILILILTIILFGKLKESTKNR